MVVGVVVGKLCREPLALWGIGALPKLPMALTFVLRVEADLRLVSGAAVETVGGCAEQDLPKAPGELCFRSAL